MNPDEKVCPDCAEVVKAAARKCKHCGYAFAPASLAPGAPLFPNTSTSHPLPLVQDIQIEAGEVITLLASLVDKSLAVYEEDTGRYRLLETVRQYSRERLQKAGDGRIWRNRHRDWFLALSEQANTFLIGPEQGVWLERLEQEHENLRSALLWCEADKEAGTEVGLRLGVALQRFWHARGHLTEGRAQFASLLALAGAEERTKVRARALNGAGTLAQNQGDYAQARSLFEECLAIMKEFGDRQGIANSLGNLGNVARDQADYTTARTLLEESLAIWRELGFKRGIAASLGNLGIVAYEQGDYAAARSLHEESLAIQRAMADKRAVANSLHNLANVTADLGDFTAARALYEESLAIRRELGDRYGIANSLGILGIDATEQGDYTNARHYLRECLRLCLELGIQRTACTMLEAWAQLDYLEQQPERATQIWGATEALREAIGSPQPPKAREDRDSALDAIRKAIGDIEFATAWQQGRAMTLEQAIEMALTVTPRPSCAS